MLDYKAPLAKSEALPRKELIEIKNDEAKSRLQMKLAKDKLLVYGLTEKEIEDAQNEDGVQKARHDSPVAVRRDPHQEERSSRETTTSPRTS